MSGAAQRWLGLAAAVAVVAVALWMLQRPASTRRSAERPAAGAGAGARGAMEPGAARGRGVAPRDTSVPGHGWVRGEVVDPDGAPLTEGQVVLSCLGDDGAVHPVRDGVLSLDGQGRFEGPGCRGLVCAALRHPFMVPAEPWSLRSGAEPTLEARALPRLWGRVVDPSGEAVAGAQLTLALPPDDDDPTAVLPLVATQTSSDADGEFSVAQIERPPCDPCQEAAGGCPTSLLPLAARVLVTARAPGWAPGARTVDLDEEGSDPDAPVEVVVQPARDAITGRLVDGDGQALPRAFVLARSEPRAAEQHRAEALDGVFAFDALGEGPYTVRAIQDGRELLRREGVQPGATLELSLPDPAIDVELAVVDEHGRPWPDVLVEGGPFARQRSDAGGIVRAQRVIPGAYILRIRPRGAPAQAHDLEVPGPPGARNPTALRITVSGAP